MLAPAAGRPWRDGWPLVAQTDDGNPWGTGACWLYCRREDVRVLWVGSVNTPGATGDVYACGPCLVELDAIVRAQAHGRDGAGGRAMQAAALAAPTHATSDGPGTAGVRAPADHEPPRQDLLPRLRAVTSPPLGRSPSYERAWEWLAESAEYGAPARRLIGRARVLPDLG